MIPSTTSSIDAPTAICTTCASKVSQLIVAHSQELRNRHRQWSDFSKFEMQEATILIQKLRDELAEKEKVLTDKEKVLVDKEKALADKEKRLDVWKEESTYWKDRYEGFVREFAEIVDTRNSMGGGTAEKP
jgi:hypothetical protein